MPPLDHQALDTIFLEARTHSAWLDKPVTDEQLKAIYETLKFGPTSANSSPMRVVFVKSKEAKEKLKPCLNAGNVDKTMSAPVVAIIAQNMEFYENMPKLFPQTDAKAWFVGKPDYIASSAFRNASLQGAYLIIAARALGLDCGPMSGFKNAAVDEAFFKGTPIKSNFLCNIGYGDVSKIHPRLPRLNFDEACRIE